MKSNIFDGGKVFINSEVKNIGELNWNEHPSFKGVFMKHLITGDDTGSSYSCHLVRIEPGCEIGIHLHEGKTEVHEVLEGKGKCTIGENEIIYSEGNISLIPSDIVHKVEAEKDGLTIFAKFFPSLL